MWQVQNHQLVGHLGMGQRERPGDRAAPVVTNDGGALLPGVLDDCRDIGKVIRHGVRRNPIRLVATVVAAQVDGYDVVLARERRHLVSPCVPEVRKSMDHHHQWALAEAGVVDTHAVVVGIAVLYAVEHILRRGGADNSQNDDQHQSESSHSQSFVFHTTVGQPVLRDGHSSRHGRRAGLH